MQTCPGVIQHQRSGGAKKYKTIRQCDPPNGYPRHASCLGSFLTRQESRHGQPSVIADGQMNFSHTYAVHTCTKCKAYSHTSKGAPNWSRFYLLLAIGFAVPLWLFVTLSHWELPWYYFVSVVALELLLFYVVGFVGGLILMVFGKRPSRCPECHAPLLLNGSYFNDSEKMNSEDIVLTVLFVAANAGLWAFLLTSA